MPISPLDFVLLQFGSPGYYQVFLSALLCFLQLPITFTDNLFRYYTLEPPHRCLISNRHVRAHGSSRELHKNEWFPVLNDGERSPSQQNLNIRPLIERILFVSPNSSSSIQFDQCNVYVDPVYHWKGTQACPAGWEYWLPNNEQNLITEFNLVCEHKQLLVILFNTICIVAFFGAILFGLAADKWGRTKILHCTIYLFVASSLSAYFAEDFAQFAVFYSFQVFFVSGLQICVYVLLLEILPTPFQLQASLLWLICQIITSLLVPILTNVVNNWRYMQLSVAVPSFAFFTYVFVIPASPLWLTVVKHDLSAAFQTLSLFGKFNCKELSDNQLNTHIQNLHSSALSFVCQTPTTVTPRPASPFSQFGHTHQTIHIEPKLSKPSPILRWYFLTHFYLFFVVTLVNSPLVEEHSLMLHQSMHGNAIYNGFLQLGVAILAYHLASWLGGRVVQALFFIFDGALIVGAIVLREYFKNKTTSDVEESNFDFRLFLLPPIMIVLARSLSHCIVAFTWYYAVKTIPTKIRATGLGFCFFWSQIAKMSVPHLIVLSNYLTHNQVLMTFGVMAMLAGLLTLLFPSMEKKPLPNTLDDLQSKSSARCSNTFSDSTFKRYPSYHDLKSNCGSSKSDKTQTSTLNIYTIPRTGTSFSSENNSMRVTQVKSAQFDDEFSSALQRNSPQNVDLNELMNLIQIQQHQQQQLQTSRTTLSGSMTRFGNESDKSSLSLRNNTMSRATFGPSSILQMTPSTSFEHERPGPGHHIFDSLAFEKENETNTNIFTTTVSVELNNEQTMVESVEPVVRALRPSFAYARNLSR